MTLAKTLIEEMETPEEKETEKDHTSLISPIKEYHNKLIEAVLLYEDDVVELEKIRTRLRNDANNLAAFCTRLEAQIVNVTNLKSKREDIKKWSADCLALLEPKKEEEKVA